MDYAEAMSFIRSAQTFGIRLGLERMRRLLDLLDHPEACMKVIHIAGTNGKGSTASYCAAILAAAGARVGLYTSPYLERFSERIRIIDGPAGLNRLTKDETSGEIEPEKLAAILTRVRDAVRVMLATGQEHPTEFELITAASLIYFKEQACDSIVLETGLGGRLDSTNVIAQPERVIITALGMDHMERLGDSLMAIAAEKAGIIKPGCPVVLYDPVAASPDRPEEAAAARELLCRRCQELAAPLTIIEPDQIEQLDYQMSGQTFRFAGQTYWTRLLGLFQPMNAALAIQALADLAPQEALTAGIREARWPGRLEMFRLERFQKTTLLLDGAHNAQGCRALSEALDRLLPARTIILVLGLLADKDYPAMLAALFQKRRFRIATVFCVTPDNPRALPARRLAAALSELKRTGDSGYNVPDTIQMLDDPAEGLNQALRQAGQDGAAVCACGSLYLIGPLRTWVRNHL
jgi:dihydrofolate synthase/folylpolyglutamate synthase